MADDKNARSQRAAKPVTPAGYSLGAQGRDSFFDFFAKLTAVSLAVGQIVSALGCVLQPLGAIYVMNRAADGENWPLLAVAIAAAPVGFLYSVAMLVVFTRVKSL